MKRVTAEAWRACVRVMTQETHKLITQDTGSRIYTGRGGEVLETEAIIRSHAEGGASMGGRTRQPLRD